MAKSYHVFKDTRGVEPFKRLENSALVPRRFRFNVSAGMRFEDEVGCGINDLIRSGRVTTAVVKGLFYGFTWEDPKLAEHEIRGAVQVFVDGGGDIGELYSQMIDALNDSGTFGRKKEPPPDPPDAGAAGADGSAPVSSSSPPAEATTA